MSKNIWKRSGMTASPSRRGIVPSIICLLLVVVYFFNICNASSTKVLCETTKGPLQIAVYEEWSPVGASRFLELVEDGFYTNIALYRCVDRFLVQFGISEQTELKHWHRNRILDDPNLGIGIKKNYISFAGGGVNSRSTQLFIAFENLDFLGKEPWETPFGKYKSFSKPHF